MKMVVIQLPIMIYVINLLYWKNTLFILLHTDLTFQTTYTHYVIIYIWVKFLKLTYLSMIKILQFFRILIELNLINWCNKSTMHQSHMTSEKKSILINHNEICDFYAIMIFALDQTLKSQKEVSFMLT
jgi:hypothetical protein